MCKQPPHRLPDGKGYVLNGEKRSSPMVACPRADRHGANPVAGSPETKVTAFLVTPDLPGFRVSRRACRSAASAAPPPLALAFRDMFVPKENVLGPIGKACAWR